MSVKEGGDQVIIGNVKSHGGSWAEDASAMTNDPERTVMFGSVQQQPSGGISKIVFVVILVVIAVAVGVYFYGGGIVM